MFIKPDDFNKSVDKFKIDYCELYEMFEYLDKSRDDYISENIRLRKGIKSLLFLLFLYSIIVCLFILF